MSGRGARWWLSRLRAMSIQEIGHRVRRAASYPLNVVQIRTGHYGRIPRTAQRELVRWRGPRRFYFDADLGKLPAGDRIREEAIAICAGRRQILGLGWRQLPDVPWHVEPRVNETWPMRVSARVVGAAPDHLDARLTWEINRGHEWVVLSRVFAGTGDRRFVTRVASELSSWRKSNPIGMGINWVSAMEAAIRIHSLSWTAAFLRGSDSDVLPTIGTMIYEHAMFVANHLSAYSSANNHRIVELSGLIIAARVLDDAGILTALRKQATADLQIECLRQVFSDGVNAEMATHYHAFVLEALLLVALLERTHGEPRAELERVTTNMAAYLELLRNDDGSLLQQGDSDDGKIIPFLASDHAGQLISAASFRGVTRGSVTNPAGEQDGLFWLTNGAPPPAPRAARVSRNLSASGQIVLRSNHITIAFDAGPFGFGALAAHAHCDALAINAALEGHRFLVDRGTFRYNGDPIARDRFRATAAHNTVQIGTREQAEAAGPFLWSRRPHTTVERVDIDGDSDVVVAAHDGFAPATHRRTLVREGDAVLVLDVISKSSETATSRYHFPPELVITTSPSEIGTLVRVRKRDRDVGWLWLSAPRVAIIESPHSDHYSATTTAPTIECDLELGSLVSCIGVASSSPLTTVRQLVQRAVERGVSSNAFAPILRRD